MSSVEVRAAKARAGSNRKRDRVALATADAETRGDRDQRRREQMRDSAGAAAAWEAAQPTLRRAVPLSTFRIWVEPLSAVGLLDGALCLEVPQPIRAWVERRYGSLFGNAVRDETDLRGVFLLEALPAPDEGLL